jgi:hypothetical protein
MKSNRRDFFTNSAMLSAGLAAGIFSHGSGSASQENKPGAESWNQDKAVRKGDDRLLKIGGIFGLWSHTSSTWWRYLNPPEEYARATGMRVTHLWCVDPEAGKLLAERYDAEIVSHYDDMAGLVDGMFIDDFFVTPFMPELSLPYLEAGIPCFFDRPMASSMAGAKKVINASKKSGTPFMVASAYEYLKEVEVMHRRLKDIGEITAYEARNSGSSAYMYALHGLWFTLKAMGIDVERIGYRTANPVNAPGLASLEHRRNGNLFYGTMHQARMSDVMCSVRAYGAKRDCEVTCAVDGRPWNKDIYTYLEMLHAMERMIHSRTAPEPLEYTEAKMRIFISLLHSVYAKDGALVEVASLPESWDAGFPGGFTRSYSDDVIEQYKKALKR